MEYFDICDSSGRPTGEMISREEAHEKGVPHRTAHVWIVRSSQNGPEILLQKRSSNKDSFPGLYDTSSAGHIPAGSEPLPSALRELEEELGITATPEQLTFIGFFRIRFEKVFHDKLFCDNEFANVYVYQEPVDITKLTLQESEVEEVRWFLLEEVYQEIQTCHDRFCVTEEGLVLLRDYLQAQSVTP